MRSDPSTKLDRDDASAMAHVYPSVLKHGRVFTVNRHSVGESSPIVGPYSSD